MRIGRWFSARRPMIEKVERHISQGFYVAAAIDLVERERGARSLDKFYKDHVREKNNGIIVSRRGRKVVANGS